MLAPPQARHLQPGAVADPGGAVDTDSNASRAGEVERKLWLDNFFSAGSVLERGSRYRPVPSAGSGAVALLILEQLRARAASTPLVTLPIVHCAQNWSARCSRSA